MPSTRREFLKQAGAAATVLGAAGAGGGAARPAFAADAAAKPAGANERFVIACIGPATAKTAEEHGLRVDVMAPAPSAGALAQALAEFGARRRDTAVAAGEPVYRPSERRPGSRRKAAR